MGRILEYSVPARERPTNELKHEFLWEVPRQIPNTTPPFKSLSPHPLEYDNARWCSIICWAHTGIIAPTGAFPCCTPFRETRKLKINSNDLKAPLVRIGPEKDGLSSLNKALSIKKSTMLYVSGVPSVNR